MELLEGIETRRSFRAFKPAPVSRETMEKILKAAGRSPSYTNTQPWEVAVVTGKKKDELSKVLYKIADSDAAPSPEIPAQKIWPAALEKRSREHGARRFAALGIERENAQQRKDLRLANFKFYGAPCVLFLFIDRTLSAYSIYDMGLFSQTLILAAHSLGVESCLQAAIAGYPDAVRDVLGIPKTKLLVIGISMGYPDNDAPINSYKSARMGTDEFARWYE
jgi:nitroreductase